jgi:methyltransferase
MIRPLILLALVVPPMIAETRRSRRHERALRAAGAIEPPGDVYRALQIAYPAAFVAMILEGWRRSAGARVPVAGLLVFASGKALKYWAIRTLGPRWTFRVLVPPGAPRLTTGPYRWLRHPNYAGVAGELAGVALMARAPRTGLVALLAFGGLMLARIAVEERALEARDSHS